MLRVLRVTAWFLAAAQARSALLSRRLAFLSPSRGATGGGTLRAEDVAFGVLTCSQYLCSRLRGQQETWLRHAPHVVAFSDALPSPGCDVDAMDVVVDHGRPQPQDRMQRDGAPRALSTLE